MAPRSLGSELNALMPGEGASPVAGRTPENEGTGDRTEPREAATPVSPSIFVGEDGGPPFLNGWGNVQRPEQPDRGTQMLGILLIYATCWIVVLAVLLIVKPWL